MTSSLVEVLLRQAEPGPGRSSRIGSAAWSRPPGCTSRSHRPDDAITTWEQVLEIAPERGDAIVRARELYSEQGRWHDVVDLFERRLGFVTSIDEAVALRVQLGELLREPAPRRRGRDRQLRGRARRQRAPARRRSPRSSATSTTPRSRAQAAEVLEPIYVAQQDGPDLVRVYEAKLERGDRPGRPPAAHPVRRAALRGAARGLRARDAVVREGVPRGPRGSGVRDQLQRLASIVDELGSSSPTPTRHFLDDEPGESEDVRDIAIAAARDLRPAARRRRSARHAAYRRALVIDVDGRGAR